MKTNRGGHDDNDERKWLATYCRLKYISSLTTREDGGIETYGEMHMGGREQPMVEGNNAFSLIPTKHGGMEVSECRWSDTDALHADVQTHPQNLGPLSDDE